MRSMSEMRRMLTYLRSDRTTRAAGPSGDGMARLMLGPALLETLGDDMVQRRILHAHVQERVAIQNGGEHLRDAPALHLEVGDRPFAARHLAEAGQVVGRRL